MSLRELELVEAAGLKGCPVLSRRPLTIAVGRRSYVPGLVAALITYGAVYRDGWPDALGAALLAGALLTLSLVAHECGHLLLARRVRGVTPRLLLLRSSGCVSIVEGRYADARGAALFAAGGPLATLGAAVFFAGAGLLTPAGAFSTAFVLLAFLNLAVLGLNLLPVAPMDGYMLFRAAVWARVGNRAEADRRAIGWSRCVLLLGLAVSLLVFTGDRRTGVYAFVVLATLAVQHHAASRQLAGARAAG